MEGDARDDEVGGSVASPSILAPVGGKVGRTAPEWCMLPLMQSAGHVHTDRSGGAADPYRAHQCGIGSHGRWSLRGSR
jgi:hypothetical protein